MKRQVSGFGASHRCIHDDRNAKLRWLAPNPLTFTSDSSTVTQTVKVAGEALTVKKVPHRLGFALRTVCALGESPSPSYRGPHRKGNSSCPSAPGLTL